jgi:prepilin-type N-terminal cleavage/methylation domain-containing protein
LKKVMKLFCSHQHGVSLTETILAIAILAIISAALVGGLFVSIQGDQVARKRISAEGLARYELEYVKARNYWDTITWTYTLPGSPPSWDATHNSLPSAYDGYTVTVAAAPATGYSGTTNIQKVTATVIYNGIQVLSLDTYRTQ